MKKLLLIWLGLLVFCGASSPVYATTLVSGHIEGTGGLWAQYGNKFYLFNTLTTPGFDKMVIDSFTSLADILVGANKPTHIAFAGMGTANQNPGALTVLDFAIYNADTLLLSATLGNNAGTLSYLSALGSNVVNFDVLSDLTVTGGSLFTQGLVTGIISLGVNGKYFEDLSNPKDLSFGDISFSVDYTPGSPPNPIPEPATSVLLISSLAGIVARRKRAKAIEA